MLGLRFCARAFSSCGEWGPLFIAVRGPLTIVPFLVAEHRLQMRRLSSCGPRARLLRGMWDPPRPGLEPLSPALAGRFSTTAPPAKPSSILLKLNGNHSNSLERPSKFPPSPYPRRSILSLAMFRMLAHDENKKPTRTVVGFMVVFNFSQAIYPIVCWAGPLPPPRP